MLRRSEFFMIDPNIIVALDFPSTKEALQLVEQLDPKLCRIKIGCELFYKEGPEIVEKISGLGFSVFLDLKLHDIPNTVASAIRSLLPLKPWMISIHALGGITMMKAALEASRSSPKPPLLTAVTVLTSLDNAQAQEIFATDASVMAIRLAKMAEKAGCPALVTSAHEIPLFKERLQHKPRFVVPGIRLEKSDDDQKRVATPKEAWAAGADFLVIGRPITRAKDPLAVLRALYGPA